MATRRGTSENVFPDFEQRIVEVAITLAEEVGWENVRLRMVAERLDVPLRELASSFRDLDAVADAWFQRARERMLDPVPPEFCALPARQRLQTLLLRWFDATSKHRRVSVQMLTGKLWPFHPHHWVPLIFDLSRTILWLRDAAALDAGSPRRELEEVGLTWLFLLTLLVWANDESEGAGPNTALSAKALSRRGRADDPAFRSAAAGKCNRPEIVPSERTVEHPLVMFQREMDRLFEEFRRDFDLPTLARRERTGGYLSPKIDISEKDDDIVVSAELPGLEEKDVDVTLTDNVLLIRGEKKLGKEEKESGYTYTERSYGSFERRTPIDAEVLSDKVSAVFKNGVLTVTLPKSPEAQKHVRRIPIGGAGESEKKAACSTSYRGGLADGPPLHIRR